ncbi:MAG: DUF6249 domain-containing protein [Prevotella sp.]
MKNMKQQIIALAMLFALNTSATVVQPQHRHHPQVEIADTTSQDEIEAFSDTTDTSLVGTKDTVYTSISYDDEVESKMDRFISKLVGGTIGVGGVIIAVLVILALLLCALAPFILIALIIRYLINRHNNSVTLAEKAMETGQPIPDELKPLTPESPDYYKRKGIKNIAIGVGLALMFFIWDSDMLAGIGLLIACWGIGQVIIAKTTK